MQEDQLLPKHKNCFVCDGETPYGMGVDWYGMADGRGIYGTVSLSERYEGPPRHAHGGASAALLDDAMGSAAWFAGYQVMTAKMSVNYRRPIPLNTPVMVTASVTGSNGRKVFVHGNICAADGTLLVDGDGLFVQIPSEFVAAFAEKFKEIRQFSQTSQAKLAQPVEIDR